jgi:hypothetical protein
LGAANAISSLGVVGRQPERVPFPEIATACLLAPAQVSSTKPDITSHPKGMLIPQYRTHAKSRMGKYRQYTRLTLQRFVSRLARRFGGWEIKLSRITIIPSTRNAANQ